MEINRDSKIFEKVARYSLDIICMIARNGCFVYVSEASKTVLGYESQEMIGRSYIDFIHPKDRARTLQIIQEIGQGNQTHYYENAYLHKTGQEMTLLWSGVWSEEDEAFFCIARNITEQKLASQKLKEERELHQTLVEYGSDTTALLDATGNYLYVNGSISNTLGYEPNQLLGTNAFSNVHPEDLPKVWQSWTHLDGQEHIKISDYRYRKADGQWVWFETIVRNQLQNPAVRGMVVNARNITERKISSFQLAESQQRFRSLFEDNPDMVLIENRDGIIVDINPAGEAFKDKPKEEIINRHFSDFLPAETIPIISRHLQEALNGHTQKFEIALSSSPTGKRIVDITKIPIKVNGQITGVHTIVKDITAITQYHNLVKQQAEKLSTIFESITDAFFTLDRNWNFGFINTEFTRLMQIGREDLVGRNIWEVFPEEADKVFDQHYRQVLATGKSVHFEAYLQRLRIWLEVKAFPSEEGLSVYLDDVTEKVRSKQELEKLSLVASKTTNGVIIMGAAGLTEWVNESFTNITGYTLADMIHKHPGSLLQGHETDSAVSQKIKAKIKQAQPFSEEILNYKKTGEKIWLSLDITPVLNEVGEVSRYIAIQTDITFRKEAEEAQVRLTNDLYRQNRDLQQFTYIVSHNLRAPVANALGLTDLLNQLDKGSASFDQALANLKISMDSLDTVLKDLNLILSIRDNEESIEKEKVDLRLICQQALATVQDSLEACRGGVAIGIPEGLCIRGNKAYFYSIFYNLFSNAIKYRSPDRPLQIQIQCFHKPASGITLSISDNGLGFDMDKVGPNIFRLYKRFHKAPEGRGIGLFLVKTHVEAMGGQIAVSSQVNSGTCFSIHLPL